MADRIRRAVEDALRVSPEGQQKLARQGKMSARERVAARSTTAALSRTACWPTRWGRSLPADGVITGQGTVDGRRALVVANDPTVKAGSWGALNS